MRYLSLLTTVAAAMMLAASTAYAVPITFTANLIGANEVPPTGSPGTGFATVMPRYGGQYDARRRDI